MKLTDLKFNSVFDIATCLEDEKNLKNFLKNLAEVCCEVYENSSEEVSGILLEQSKKIFYNIDVAIVVKALTTSIKNIVEDENKKAKIEYFFHSQNKQKTKNLRFIIDYLSLKNICPNSDKKYLFATALYENQTKEKFFTSAGIGFSREKFEEILDDHDAFELVEDMSTTGDIKLIGFGKAAKAIMDEKEISLFNVLEVKNFTKKKSN